MKSLFARIFIGFWGLMLVIMVMTGTTVAFIAWHRFSSVADFNPQLTAQAAQRALDTSGRHGLRDWLVTSAKSENGVTVYVLDAQGHDLLERDAPPMIRNAAALARDRDSKAMLAASRPAFMQKQSHILLSCELTDRRRETWWLIAAWSGSTPFDVLASSSTWLTLVVLFVVLGSALCWLLARGISRPIIALQDHAKRLAKGEFEAAMGPELTQRTDEIGQLALEFNQMSEQIREQLASKEMLLRDISHELRSPLTRLRVAAGLARAQGEAIDVHLGRIERDIERLDRLIDDTLRFSMVTTPGISLSFDQIDIVALAGEALRDAEIEAQTKGLHLRLGEHEPIVIPADGDLLYRAIDNVLRNAIRHSPEAGVIDVAFSLSANTIELKIVDQGPGVPESELEQIFEAFYRVSPARERSSGGAGLGLALASRILALHGGRIFARNGEQRGLAVTLQLPMQ